MNNRAKELVEKWKEVLDIEDGEDGKGKKITNSRIKSATALMLENEFNYLHGNAMNEAGGNIEGTFSRSAGYTTSGDFYKIAVPMVRRTFPELIAHDLVGVQPMAGPVGLAFALRFRAGQTYDSQSVTEIGYNRMDDTYTQTGSVSAGEALGSNAATTLQDTGYGLGIGTGASIKEVTMTIEKTQVTAETRKLRARWSLEVAQDLQAMHGLVMEDEMMDILSYEITAEIDREIINTIRTSAKNGQAGLLTPATSGNFDYSAADGQWEAEKYRNLYNKLIRKANEIAISTRRGAGNWVVCHPTVCAGFEATSAFTIAPVANDLNTALIGVAKLGSLDGRIAVYRDTFATTADFVVGFKGSSEYDTGIIYLPYIPLMVSRATFQDSFNPTVGLMSRYGIVENLFGSSLYYRYIKCINMPS